MPGGIEPVERAAVNALGMVGWHNDAWIIDAHHIAHPSCRGGGKRALSIGFTGHYELMQTRFGNAPLGVAGENIIIDGPALGLAELGDGLIIETLGGDDLRLLRPGVAAPCLEFASFMLGLDYVASRGELAAPMADLNDGRRGFIFAADRGTSPVELRLGDSVYAIVGAD